MAVIETWLKTDLKSIVKVNMFHGILFSQDNMANLIGVELLDGGEPATVTGSVSANVLRADGTTVAVAGTLSGNKASVTLPQAAYAVPGMLAIVIKLTDSSTVTTIGAIQSIVYRASTDTIIDPGTIIPSVQDLIAAIDAAVDSIPPDYSALTGEVSDLKSAIVHNNGIGEVTRANCDFYTITGTNLIKTQNRKITENTVWSPSQNKYVPYSGRFCIKDIKVVPGTTYYYLATYAYEFSATGELLVTNSGNLGGSRSFTASANTAYVVLNYNSVPTGNIGGETYVLTTHNGTQTPVKVKDPELLLQDSNFAEYGVEFSKIADKALSPLKCGIMDEYGTTIDINDCTITATNVELLDTGKSKFSRGSKMVRLTKTSGVTDYNIVITLPKTISANRWWVTMMLTAETADTTTGSYAGLRINNLTNNVRATNGHTTENTWCFLGPHHGSAQSISSIKLVFTPRSGANNGDVCGVYWIDSITFNAKMKPTFILNFDQWWQDSIDNGGYQYCFTNNVPFTMMTKNYDQLSSTFKALAHKAETYGCENGYYASYGSSNTSLLNASTYATAVSEVSNTQNDFANEFGEKYISFGCTQMKFNQLDRTALLADGVKMIRGKASDFIDYFDTACWWTPSKGISATEMTITQIKERIDHVITFGGCFLAFTHGICADTATVMDGSNSNGIKVSDFKEMIDYLVAKRTAGDIQICTMQDWYNQCAT